MFYSIEKAKLVADQIERLATKIPISPQGRP